MVGDEDQGDSETRQAPSSSFDHDDGGHRSSNSTTGDLFEKKRRPGYVLGMFLDEFCQ